MFCVWMVLVFGVGAFRVLFQLWGAECCFVFVVGNEFAVYRMCSIVKIGG